MGLHSRQSNKFAFLGLLLLLLPGEGRILATRSLSTRLLSFQQGGQACHGLMWSEGWALSRSRCQATGSQQLSFLEGSCVCWRGAVWSCLHLFLLGFGMALVGWSGVCVSAPRTAPGSENVGRAAHPGASGAKLRGDFTCPGIAPESRVSPSLHAARRCCTSAMAFKACTAALCSLINGLIKS